MACDLAHKHWSWLRVGIEYLTLAGSNALALVLRYTNRTDARMSPNGGVAVWTRPGGTHDNSSSALGEARRAPREASGRFQRRWPVREVDGGRIPRPATR